MDYRVVKITTDDFAGGKSESETIWQGSDTNELSNLYPPSKVYGADQLGHHEIEGGMIHWDHRFEKLENGQWTECPDPRHRINRELSDLEMEIDAENRRDFPGDFADEDDDEELYNDGNDYETDEDYYPAQYD